MPKPSLDLIKIPDLDVIKKLRFSFIDDDVLQTNLSITMQHIVFLVYLGKEYELPGPKLLFSLPKELIVLTACIVEAVIHFTIKKLIQTGKFSEEVLFGREEKYLDWKKIVDDKVEGEWGAARKIRKVKSLNDDMKFQDLNSAAKNCGLFDNELFNKAQEIRKKRNRIHLMGLNYIEDNYTETEANKVFVDAKEIIKKCSEFI